jgi:hypothetical protein
VLHGFESNAKRVAKLRDIMSFRPALNEIGLYRMHHVDRRMGDDGPYPTYRNVEELDISHWPGLSTSIYSYSGSGAFDFPNVRGLVMSQHPYFWSTLYNQDDGTLKANDDMSSIVVAANAWAKRGADDKPRHVIYPLWEYDEAVQSLAVGDRSFHTSFGPRLYTALVHLGAKARAPSDDPFQDEDDFPNA